MSPPSSFFAQSQAILLAVTYLEPLHSGYPGAANKHKNRMRSSFLVQLMAAFEFTMKDFIAQTLDVTHIYDESASTWSWLQLNVSQVLSTRSGLGRLGGVLVHPLLGWQTPEVMNRRYQDVYEREPIASDELNTLGRLWVIRHSISHNGGVVSAADAARLRTPQLTDQQLLIDEQFLISATYFLREIVRRLSTVVGESILSRWFREGATSTWQGDEETYIRIKQLVACEERRASAIGVAVEADYLRDRGNLT